jgi:hypothetical protein
MVPKAEVEIQRRILAALGAEPDLLLMRNTVGDVVYYDEDGRKRTYKYGLGAGSPDIVGILNGRWFCLEVKTPTGVMSAQQKLVGEIWKRFGAMVFVVTSVAEARDALVDARRSLGIR